ncbi:hypothetical protein B0H19DRAFT_78875 [Mycena capillaripes]|nr:hypothetical protein B0H19DRAFT_78875 [Mycena capillaripes]
MTMELKPVCKRSDTVLSDSDTLTGNEQSQSGSGVTFTPISVESFNRYSRGRCVKKDPTEYFLPPFSRSFSRNSIADWTPHRHPEGALYFVHHQNKIFTDAYLYEDKIVAKLNTCVSHIRRLLEDKGPLDLNTDKIDIVLDLLDEQSETIKCGYYLVDHSKRAIFWMDGFEMSQLSSWKRVPGIFSAGIVSASHIGLILEHEYWQHCDLFPAAHLLTPGLVSELRDTIIHSATDALTSPTTTTPFSVDDLLKMNALTNGISFPSDGARTESFGVQIDQGSPSAFARLMMLFAQERINHFHGEYAARLDRDNSVYGQVRKRSYSMAILCPLLLNAPVRHHRDLQAIFMDDIISQLSWKRLAEKVLSEWQDITLYASLILNANVGILAVPGRANTSIAQISSYISICFGLASIILGLLLSRKYRLEAADAVSGGPAYSFKKESLQVLEGRAILFSLPYVFMMWGMFAFLSSFLIMALEISNIRTTIILLVTATALFVAILCCMLSAHGWGLARIISAVNGLRVGWSLPGLGWNKKFDVRARNEEIV